MYICIYSYAAQCSAVGSISNFFRIFVNGKLVIFIFGCTVNRSCSIYVLHLVTLLAYLLQN